MTRAELKEMSTDELLAKADTITSYIYDQYPNGIDNVPNIPAVVDCAKAHADYAAVLQELDRRLDVIEASKLV